MSVLVEGQLRLVDPGPPGDGAHPGAGEAALAELLDRGLQDLLAGAVGVALALLGCGRTAWHAATTASADLLIGADGANSRVRAQLLPHADRVDTGVLAIAGKHPLHGLPPELTERVNLVLPAGRGSLFTAVWRAGGADDYTLWGFADAASRFPPTGGLGGRQLIDLALERMPGWSPVLRELMAGIGANTALRDADLLRRKLTAQLPLREAVRAYEREMFDYGFAAVRQSLRNAKQAASGNRLARHAFRGALRLTAAVPPLKRRMARTFGT